MTRPVFARIQPLEPGVAGECYFFFGGSRNSNGSRVGVCGLVEVDPVVVLGVLVVELVVALLDSVPPPPLMLTTVTWSPTGMISELTPDTTLVAAAPSDGV